MACWPRTGHDGRSGRASKHAGWERGRGRAGFDGISRRSGGRTARTRRVALTAAISAAAALTGAVSSPLMSANAAQEHPHHAPGKTPKNVIFINGDGMSAAHREAARLYLQGLDGKLQMDRLPQSGNLTTDSRDPKTYVTDSAAAATAWATGHKTYNGAISVDVDKNPLETLGMQATRRHPRWRGGLVAPRRRRRLLPRPPGRGPERGQQGNQGEPRRGGQAAWLRLRHLCGRAEPHPLAQDPRTVRERGDVPAATRGPG